VIDVRDNAKIARELYGHETATIRARRYAVNSRNRTIPSEVEESLMQMESALTHLTGGSGNANRYTNHSTQS